MNTIDLKYSWRWVTFNAPKNKVSIKDVILAKIRDWTTLEEIKQDEKRIDMTKQNYVYWARMSKRWLDKTSENQKYDPRFYGIRRDYTRLDETRRVKTKY